MMRATTMEEEVILNSWVSTSAHSRCRKNRISSTHPESLYLRSQTTCPSGHVDTFKSCLFVGSAEHNPTDAWRDEDFKVLKRLFSSEGDNRIKETKELGRRPDCCRLIEEANILLASSHSCMGWMPGAEVGSCSVGAQELQQQLL